MVLYRVHGIRWSGFEMRRRRATLFIVLAVVSATAVHAVPSAQATGWDVYAAGTRYCASTHPQHGRYSGFGPSIDINVGTARADYRLPLFAPSEGHVTIAGGGAWGRAIIWSSESDWRTSDEALFMAHLDEVVKTGAVNASDLIARVGDSGRSSAPHLHIERRAEGRPAEVVLSGRSIVPADDPGCNTFVSVGPARSDTYRWELVSQHTYTDASLETKITDVRYYPGQTAWWVVRARNVGTATWHRSGSTPIVLGTDGPRDRLSRFATPQWPNARRATRLREALVQPGKIGTFEFPVRVADGRRLGGERFNLVAENHGWFNDAGLSFRVRVPLAYSCRPSARSRHPNGTLIASPPDPQLYVLVGGIKRPVSWNALSTWFPDAERTQVCLVSQLEMDAYETGGPLGFADGSLLGFGDRVWFVTDGVKRPVSGPALRQLFPNYRNWLISVSEAEADAHPNGPPIPKPHDLRPDAAVVRADSHYAATFGGRLWPFPSHAAYRSRHVHGQAAPIGAEERDRYPRAENSGLGPRARIGFRDGTLLTDPETGATYVVSDQLRRLIPSRETLACLGYRSAATITARPSDLALHSQGAPLQDCTSQPAIDTEGPLIGLEPDTGALASQTADPPSVPVRAHFADPGSGIDIRYAKIYVDGQDRTPRAGLRFVRDNFAEALVSFVLQPDELSAEFRIVARDLAGNWSDRTIRGIVR